MNDAESGLYEIFKFESDEALGTSAVDESA